MDSKHALVILVTVALLQTTISQPISVSGANDISERNEISVGFPKSVRFNGNSKPSNKYQFSRPAQLKSGAQKGDISYTVHGPNSRSLDAEMSPEDKSKHGCMDTMKRSNEDKEKKMSEKEMRSACEMYAQWGKSMRKKPQWKPTDGQMQWWASLGEGTKSHRHEPRGKGVRSPRQSGSGKAVRKEYRMLSDDERHDFHEAVKILKNTAMDGVSKYDLFVNFHQGNVAPGAHFGPAFLGYHRELLHRPGPMVRNPYMYPPRRYYGYSRSFPMLPPPPPPPMPYWHQMRFFKI